VFENAISIHIIQAQLAYIVQTHLKWCARISFFLTVKESIEILTEYLLHRIKFLLLFPIATRGEVKDLMDHSISA